MSTAGDPTWTPPTDASLGVDHASSGGVFAGGGEMGQVMRAMDWSRTPLGPTEQWSPTHRMMVGVLLANRFTLLRWWGPNYVQLYNDAYRPVLGTKHPRSMGQPASECWPEIWDIIGPLVDTPFNGGPSTWMEDIFLEPERHGFVEETHFTIAYSPVPDATAARGIGGVLATVHEITEQVIADRRLRVLRDLGARSLTEAQTAETACAKVAEILERHAKDVPFALLYLIDADGTSARLAGAAGVEPGLAISPLTVALNSGDGGWPLGDAIRHEAIQVVSGIGSRFAHVPQGPWSDPPNTAVVLPIPSNLAHRPAGVLVAGASARLAFDDSYRGFAELLTAQVATVVANARAYEEEKRRAEALAELDRAKTAFFSNVSHEFRTPLTLMLGPLGEVLAQPETLTPAARAELSVTQRNALRLLKLVNTLLDFSRIEAGRVEAKYEPTDLATHTADLASSFRSAIDRAGLRLVVDTPPLSRPVYVDRDMWEKVVLNLLSNAFKHTFDGEIAVALRESETEAVLDIRDTGVGIPDEQLPRLFDRFHRVPSTRARTHEGTGIGLALVQELVRLHGGHVEVKSEEGAGTTFSVRLRFGTGHLPRERVAMASEDLDQASTALGAAPYVEEALRWLPKGTDEVDPYLDERDVANAMARGGATPTRAEGRVLVADDNADMRDYVARLLRAQGWTVETTPDGAAALAAARARRPDLVLTDVMMPALDGFALLRELRSDPMTSAVPVMLLSARAGEESRIEGLDAGADDYLVKPFSAQELVTRVAAHVRLARFRRDGEAKFRAMFEQSAVGMAHVAPDGRWMDVNARLCAMLGYTREELRARTITDVTHPDDRARDAAAYRSMLAGEAPGYQTEKRYLRKDGSSVWGQLTTVFVREPEGGSAYFVSVIEDITVRKWTEEAVRRRTAQFETLLNEAPLGVYLVDSDFRIVAVNPTALPTFGDIPDLIGRDFAEVMHILWPKEYANEVVARFRHTLETGDPYVEPERVAQRRDRGVREVYEWRINRLPLPDDRYGVVCYFRDISTQVLAREMIDAARATAEHANRSKSEFLAAMSHELRTPLNAIAGHAQLVEMGVHGPVTAAQREALSRIQRSEQHLLALINDVLNFAKLEAGRVQYDIERVPLREVAADVVSMIEPQVAAKGLVCGIHVAPDAAARADREKLRQVLLNLLSNAVKFTKPGGRVTVGTADDGPSPDGVILLRVSDTGIGIPHDKQDSIFDPFVQVHRDLTNTNAGTGLGLAISRDLARGMGGDLGVESVEGQGSTFTLTLPRA